MQVKQAPAAKDPTCRLSNTRTPQSRACVTCFLCDEECRFEMSNGENRPAILPRPSFETGIDARVAATAEPVVNRRPPFQPERAHTA
jgi:hypothetical protein